MTSSAYRTSIILRDIEDVAEMRAVEDLQVETWGDVERDIVPVNQLAAAQYVGGSLVGAFDGQVMAGFVYGFYGHIHGQIVHHSHMLAVLPAYRNHNLALRLKLAQRERVLAQRLTDRITWTFDPLQSLNAHFNFAKLGVISSTYKVNVYGKSGASFLHQNGTDRLFVTWLLDSPRVIDRITEKSMPSRDLLKATEHALPLIQYSDSGGPERSSGGAEYSEAEAAVIEIPADITSMEETDFEKARLWRLETRKAFSEMLAVGFIVTDYFRKSEKTGCYVLEKKRPESRSTE